MSDCLKSTPFFIVAAPELVSYENLMTTARKLRSFSSHFDCPFIQDLALMTDSIDLPQDKPESILDDMQILFTLNNEVSFLKSIYRLLPNTYQCTCTVFCQCIQIVYDAMQKCFQINQTDCNNAEEEFFRQIVFINNSDECFSCLESSLKELWKNSSSHVTGGSLCGHIVQYIENNYKQQISMAALSERFGYTASYINRIFKKEYNMSPLQYLTEMKINRAKEIMLKNPEINIKSVAQSVGYEDSRYFSRIFKHECKLTPTAWIKAQEKDSAPSKN